MQKYCLQNFEFAPQHGWQSDASATSKLRTKRRERACGLLACPASVPDHSRPPEIWFEVAELRFDIGKISVNTQNPYEIFYKPCGEPDWRDGQDYWNTSLGSANAYFYSIILVVRPVGRPRCFTKHSKRAPTLPKHSRTHAPASRSIARPSFQFSASPDVRLNFSPWASSDIGILRHAYRGFILVLGKRNLYFGEFCSVFW